MSDHSQILKALDNLEAKVGPKLAELSDEIFHLKQRGAFSGGGMDDTRQTDSAGAQFVKQFADNRELFEKTRSVRLEIKAATDTITTTSGRTIVSGGVGAPGGQFLGIQNALRTRSASGTTAVEYARFTGQQGSAAQQAAEGDAKAAVRPDHTLIQQSALTIAGYAKLSRQALNDSAELKAAIDLTLARSVAGSMNVVLSNGGTGFTGYVPLATAVTSLTYTRLADAVSQYVGEMQIAGFNPDVVVMSPGTWTNVVTLQDAALSYLSGAYMGTVQQELRGLRVVLSTGVPAGKALVMDSSHSELLAVEGFSVEVAYSGDDFTKNMVTVLGEARVIPVFRSVGSALLVTPKP